VVSPGDPETNETIQTKTLECGDVNQPNPPGVWEVIIPGGLELSGEMRFEFHRRMPEVDGVRIKLTAPATKHSKLGAFGDTFLFMMKLLPCCCCFRRKQKSNGRFEGGMLFATWFHSDFLELDEPPADQRHKPHKTVRVLLDRFSLDKAANAPPLRSHSKSLQLQLEFEVDWRTEWTELDDKNVVLSSGNDISESETLHWLTFVSEKVWPSFESGFKKLVEDLIAPIGDSLPAPLKSRANVRLARFSLGPEFPKFGPMTACSKNHEGLEVQLDIMLNYETNTDIVVDLGFASLGISYLRIAGILSVKFKPILDNLPVFTAIQLLFINQPRVEVKFAKTLEIANLAVVHNIIQDTINNAIAGVLVLPNIMKINWADPDEDDSISFQNLLPSNVIRVHLVEGRNLRTEASMLKRPPDSFAKITLGSQEVITRTVAKAANPVWNSEYDMLVYDTRQEIAGMVYDIDFTGRKKVIGILDPIPVSQLVAAGEDGMWLPLVDTPAGAESSIQMRAFLFELHSDPQHLRRCLNDNAESYPEVDMLCIRDAGSPDAERTTSMEVLTPSAGEMNTTSSMIPQVADVGVSALATLNSAAELGQSAAEFGVSAYSNAFSAVTSLASQSMLLGSEESQDAGFFGGCDPQLQATEVEAGAVALLICHVVGGHIPTDLTDKRAMVDIRMHTDKAVKAGKNKISLACAEADAAPVGTISEKQKLVIERLADKGLKAEEIAAAIEEDPLEVARVMRRRGWNMSLPQKLYVFLHEDDLDGAVDIDISLHLKKQKLAQGSMAISHLLNHFNMRHTEVLKIRAVKDKGLHVDLDAEFRIYSLVPSTEIAVNTGDDALSGEMITI